MILDDGIATADSEAPDAFCTSACGRGVVSAGIYLSAAMWPRPIAGPLRFGIGVEHVRRTSHMLDSVVAGTEADVMATTAIGF